ncbi:substrate-binding domain-containing protein [Paenibacillus validus]|uniref:Substrate-binding domain-containing protein n=1 Tax=Paenibacillus validus TaxID=44253 RepID=A0A7X2ZA02_9BACL|nr:substrate-binding domain-containing protein [Paenibacillus validus]MED4600518.1 substrate-binding domain-containing protein [Paenibacillus validus]MED4604777.1 substrate-binding domain-containing protein [Paenibacillus validus]MUG71001.1 substrate-binding domain-containing protein [Paenibacillus validus]
MNLMRIMTSAALSALLLFMTACGSGSSNNNGTGAGTGSKESASSTEGAAKAGTSAAPVPIDYGLYCGKECQEALTLKASPDSIKGKVGFAVASLTFPYGAALKSRTEEAAKKYFPNMELLVGDGQNDPSVQTSIVDDFISKGVQVLIINAVEKDALVPAVERAVKAGIKVISVDRTVNTKVLTTIKANDLDLGMNAGQSLVTLLNGKGNVVELQGSPSASPTIDRHKGFTDAIAGSPDIKVIASQHANYDQAQGLKVMEDLLQRFPKGQIDAVYTHADMMTMGALQAIKAAGRQNEIKLISIDGMQTTFDAISDGEIAGTAVYPVIAPMNVIAAAKALVGEPMPEFIKLESPVVTKENVAKYNGTTY